ncbi:serine protease [Helicobacter monodelphidis]|uniref:Do family serine endopeptidase n=1 Tax=Helicobacter sp. 15-1451 TaxID=2004995 RepID=UPI000DCDC430|nr:Do family serine endopeptidase [Helicobacter sp. 15-1451]RAX56872.1 serine protease [Helicobacter sp. 15-1451]
MNTKVFFKTILAFAFCVFANAVNINDAPPIGTRVMPNPQNNTIQSYNEAINEAAKGVVNISTKKQVKTRGVSPNHPLLNDPFFRQFFGDSFGQIVPKDRVERSLGSGVIFSSEGYIITNNHVIDGADEILVALPNENKEYTAKLIGKDPKSDLAVIKIDAKKPLPFLQFAASSEILVGDIVFAIGNPFGVGETVTQGIVSALNKSGMGINDYENFIQTDASINPGNSGGALVDSRGALVGINTAIISRTGGNHGIGFAIPSDMAKRISLALIEKGVVERGFIGISIEDVKEDLKESYNGNSGAVIISVEAQSPAAKAGLKVWDLIVKVDNQPVKGAAELRNLIGTYPPNQDIVLTFMRNKQLQNVTIKLANSSEGIGTNNTDNNIIKGASLSDLNDSIRSNHRVPRNINGVIILEVQANSLADKTGFETSDIIMQIEDIAIKNIAEAKKALNQYKNRPKRLLVYRNGRIGSLLLQ